MGHLHYADLESLSVARRAVLDRTARTAVGYALNLTAQDVNDNTVDLSFIVAFSDGSFSLGLMGATNWNERTSAPSNSSSRWA